MKGNVYLYIYVSVCVCIYIYEQGENVKGKSNLGTPNSLETVELRNGATPKPAFVFVSKQIFANTKGNIFSRWPPSQIAHKEIPSASRKFLP